MDKPFGLCFVSTASCEATGGQTAYFRALGDVLSGRMAVSGAARFHTKVPTGTDFTSAEEPREIPRQGWSTHIIAQNPAFRGALPWVIRLITRPSLRSFGIELFRRAYADGLAAAMPLGTDVVHYVGAGWELIGHVALAEARKRGASLVVTPFVHPGKWGDNDLDMAFYNEVDAIFACSEYERDYLRERGVRKPHIEIIGLAPVSALTGDGARFRQKHGLGDRPLILFIARKQHYKGYHALCRAMSRVVKEVPDACLVAVGPDTEPPFPDVPPGALLDIGELTAKPEDQQEKADALAACDIFCMPSEGEAFGIVYVEAWSFGKPVIAGGAPAVRELVKNDENGYRVENQDEAQIAEYIIRLCKDPDLKRRLGEAGRRLQQERYTWDAIARAHEAVFRGTRRK